MVRTTIRLAILLLIAHALFQAVPVYWHYYQFKDAVKETARYSKGRADAQVVARVLELASQYDVPLERDSLQVWREKEHTFIEAVWVEPVELRPKYLYPWKFTVSESAWHIEPVTADSIK
jgi:hypothetical protein